MLNFDKIYAQAKASSSRSSKHSLGIQGDDVVFASTLLEGKDGSYGKDDTQIIVKDCKLSLPLDKVNKLADVTQARLVYRHILRDIIGLEWNSSLDNAIKRGFNALDSI